VRNAIKSRERLPKELPAFPRDLEGHNGQDEGWIAFDVSGWNCLYVEGFQPHWQSLKYRAVFRLVYIAHALFYGDDGHRSGIPFTLGTEERMSPVVTVWEADLGEPLGPYRYLHASRNGGDQRTVRFSRAVSDCGRDGFDDPHCEPANEHYDGCNCCELPEALIKESYQEDHTRDHYDHDVVPIEEGNESTSFICWCGYLLPPTSQEQIPGGDHEEDYRKGRGNRSPYLSCWPATNGVEPEHCHDRKGDTQDERCAAHGDANHCHGSGLDLLHQEHCGDDAEDADDEQGPEVGIIAGLLLLLLLLLLCRSSRVCRLLRLLWWLSPCSPFQSPCQQTEEASEHC
jgi:hypothetical protein